MKRNNKKGFTIVELVIVIAVIAILSAVLIPTFGSVIADANATAELQEARSAYTGFLSDPDKLTALGETELYVVVDNTAASKVYYGETGNGFGKMPATNNTPFAPDSTDIVVDMDGNYVSGCTHADGAKCPLCE